MAVGKNQLPDFNVIPGLRLGVACAGIKKAERKDLVVIEMAAGSACAGVFTRNAFCAAPVVICKENLLRNIADTGPAYLLINTGNANAGTGAEGMADARECCRALAQQVGALESSILPFSTGVIGEKLPVDTIKKSIPDALSDLSADNWASAAEGILTTDTRPKGVTAAVEYAGHTISFSGISKGAGMIKPNMATMLAYVGTDAKLSDELCQSLLSELADLSFNRITIDGDTSTNDSCMLMATGQSAAPAIDPSHTDFPAFKKALETVLIELAQAIVRDGEGATKFVTVSVEQGLTREETLETAYTIAHSPLVKTALFASDPNWGRILAALGRSPIPDFDLSKVVIYLGDVCIVESGGRSESYSEAAGQAVMDHDEISIRVLLGRGDCSETVWTTDLSRDYVTINADYRT